MLSSIILGMILETDLTGYDIKKAIEKSIGIFYKASYGSLYPALKKLTQKGDTVTYDKPLGSRQKIFYHITENGKEQFFDWLTTPTDIYESTNTHLAKVYFFDKLPPEIRDRQLLAYEINNMNYLKKLQSLENEFRKREKQDCFYYKLSTLYYGICVTQKTVQWCRHIRLQEPLADLIEPEN